MMRCDCREKDGKVVSLCGAHGQHYRYLRSIEHGIEGAEPPPRKRRPGTTPTTDAIATLAVGAGLASVARVAEGGSAWWRYPLAGFAVFLIVYALGCLLLDRKG